MPLIDILPTAKPGEPTPGLPVQAALTESELARLLSSVGMVLQKRDSRTERWAISSSAFCRSTPHFFTTLKQASHHVRHLAQRRLFELRIAQDLWSENIGTSEARRLVVWGSGITVSPPSSLRQAIHSPIPPLPKNWKVLFEKGAARFGRAHLSWLPPALMEEAPACYVAAVLATKWDFACDTERYFAVNRRTR